MEEKLEKIKNDGLEKLENAKTVEELQNIAKDMLTIAQLCNIVKIRIAKLRN